MPSRCFSITCTISKQRQNGVISVARQDLFTFYGSFSVVVLFYAAIKITRAAFLEANICIYKPRAAKLLLASKKQTNSVEQDVNF